MPGVTSAFGVPAAVGIPVTQRGLASSVTVVTGRVGDAGGVAGPDWESLARAGGTLVILMGMTTRAAVADALLRGGRARDTPVAVIARGTTAAQRVVRTSLAGLAGVDLGPPPSSSSARWRRWVPVPPDRRPRSPGRDARWW